MSSLTITTSLRSVGSLFTSGYSESDSRKESTSAAFSWMAHRPTGESGSPKKSPDYSSSKVRSIKSDILTQLMNRGFFCLVRISVPGEWGAQTQLMAAELLIHCLVQILAHEGPCWWLPKLENCKNPGFFFRSDLCARGTVYMAIPFPHFHVSYFHFRFPVSSFPIL